MLLKNFDYFPFEVQRTLASKDARYMAMFDWNADDSARYDPTSGKSLA